MSSHEMNLRLGVFHICAFCLVAGLAANPAHAQTRVGEAAVVKNQVVRVVGPATSQINVGDGVLRDEIVRTGLDSAARLVMADSTNLSLGPGATIKLDRTVFNDEHSYRDIAIRLTSGAFRFVTGHSEKTAYKITTPLATIGVRGTILDILSQRGSSTVVLQEGAASVCTLSFQCTQLTQPGSTAISGLADQRFNQMITNQVLGNVLLGVNEQINCSDCVSAFGSVGSFTAGVHGRKELTNNLSLLAGLAYTQYSEGGYHVTSAPIGAFALRYDFTDWGSSRPFFDIGTILTPYEKVRYRRSYLTSLGAVTVDGQTTASNYGVYGRAGWMSRLSPRDEVAAAVEVWQLW